MINKQSLVLGLKFLLLYPDDLPIPEMYTDEEDGEVNLNWYKGRGEELVIFFKGNNQIGFAGLWKENKTDYGYVPFDGSVIPVKVLELIRETFREQDEKTNTKEDKR